MESFLQQIFKWPLLLVVVVSILTFYCMNPTVFSVQYVFEKNKNKPKEAGAGPFPKYRFEWAPTDSSPLSKWKPHQAYLEIVKRSHF